MVIYILLKKEYKFHYTFLSSKLH